MFGGRSRSPDLLYEAQLEESQMSFDLEGSTVLSSLRSLLALYLSAVSSRTRQEERMRPCVQS